MSPKIRARRRSAAASCNRIDFVASRLAAVLWTCWLACAVLVTFATDLTWILRLAIASWVVAAGARAVWRYVLLRGPRAVRSLEWRQFDAQLEFHLWLGEPGRRLPAVPQACLRYGLFLWLLRFRTPEGTHHLLVETSCQDQAALRRLCRRLDWGSGTAVGASGGKELLPSRPKV
jgi:hypothetical protein